MSRFNSRRRRGGFTLMEVLLVLIILVVLAALAVPIFTGTRKKANIDAAKAQVGLIEDAIGLYELHMNRYPTNLDNLRQAPSDTSNTDKWGGPYLKKSVGADPWGNPYQYIAPGKHNTDTYDIWSFGPDGIDGNTDDIGNWERS